jgi:hypothetical protein
MTRHDKQTPDLYTPNEVGRMRRKFNEDCEALGLYCEDGAARDALGRAVVKAFRREMDAPEPARFARRRHIGGTRWHRSRRP